MKKLLSLVLATSIAAYNAVDNGLKSEYHVEKKYSTTRGIGQRYIKSFGISAHATNCNSLPVVVQAYQAGNLLPSFRTEKTIAVGKEPILVNVIYYLPLKILEENVDGQSIDEMVLSFDSIRTESDCAKLYKQIYIRVDNDTLSQYRSEWEDWRNFNKSPKVHRMAHH